MKPFDDGEWLDVGPKLDRPDLAAKCCLSVSEVDELVDYGALVAVDGEKFSPHLVAPLRKAMRMRALFDLDLFTAGLLVRYLQRIDQLERQVRGLHPPFTEHPHERDGPVSWHEPHAGGAAGRAGEHRTHDRRD